MPVTVVVGGQFGGEGKGKVTSHLCYSNRYHVAVRCGGPNSGHTVTIEGKQVVLRQLPAGVVNKDMILYLPAGSLINLDVLFSEIDQFKITPDRLRIDNNAAIVDKAYSQVEQNLDFKDRFGSTCSGTGVAVANRVLRDRNLTLAKDVEELKSFVKDVSDELNYLHSIGKNIIVEGTQGFGLSVYHSPYYPFATSRDTTASAFLSEAGLSPLTVADIILVIRTFPIRVGGNSGHLPYEIEWKTIQDESGYPYVIQEYTSVTNRLRRVARFDIDIVKKAVISNQPTKIALMGVDYFDYKNKGVTSYGGLSLETHNFIDQLERSLNVPIDFIGTGPSVFEIIDQSYLQGSSFYEQSR